MDLSPDRVDEAIRQATEFMYSTEREDYHWCGELGAWTTGTAEYIFLCQMLGIDMSFKREKMIHYFLSKQAHNGSWSAAYALEGDLSLTAEAYLALTILGLDASLEVMKKAEKFILDKGGLAAVRVLTRIDFACFGLIPWEAIPALPAELLLLPSQFPINIFSFSSWARATIVPLLILFHHRPVFALPNGKFKDNPLLDHLFRPLPSGNNKLVPYKPPLLKVLKSHGLLSWKSFFCSIDPLIRLYDKYSIGLVRRYALRKCTQWCLTHQEADGGTAGILPPMIYGVVALSLQGYSLDSEPVKKGIASIESFSWEDSANGYRIQICNSPVWDTALGTIGLLDCGNNPNDERILNAVQWILDRQLFADYGDWKVNRPNLRPGGWSFEYYNTWYPDVDDTAAVLLALLKQSPKAVFGNSVQRAVEWTLGMQNKDGGWAAFDVNNDKLFLNEIPFSDMDSLCDPSSPDVSGRVLEAFGLLQEILKSHSDTKDTFPQGLLQEVVDSCRLGVEYLRNSQEAEGSWYGRWGVNYIYGTSNVLIGLVTFVSGASDKMIKRGLDWIKGCQNLDGGWGETLESYRDKRTMGNGVSVASQTAWAVMGLLSFLPASDLSIRRGVQWLVTRQVETQPIQSYEAGQPLPIPKGSTWEEPEYTGTGFPNHVYINYAYYRHYFPMMALGRYAQASRKFGLPARPVLGN